MIRSITILLLILTATSSSLYSQKLKKSDKEIISNLQQHELQLGQHPGPPTAAQEYINTQFQHQGLQPRGDNQSYLQWFEIYEGKDYRKASYFLIEGQAVDAADFFPLIASPEKDFEASPSMALREQGVPWFVNLEEAAKDYEGSDPFHTLNFIRKTAEEAVKKGATALIVYNYRDLRYNEKDDDSNLFPIPVIAVSPAVVKKYLSDETATINVRCKVAFSKRIKKAHNITAYLDNGSASTIVIAADTNASGTAALIEMARMLKSSKLKKNNYLFVSVSGTRAPVELSTINYTIENNVASSEQLYTRLHDVYKAIETANKTR